MSSNLRDVREDCDGTIGEVAMRMGLTSGYISKLERRPLEQLTVSTLERYADAIGCDVQITFTSADTMDSWQIYEKEDYNDEL